MVTNRRIVEGEGADWYPTPSWGTKALLKYVKFDGKIWEPCCGDGAMSKVLEEHGYDVISTDLYERGYGKGGIDFLQQNVKVNNIVTNPPFNIAEDILEKALSLTNKKVCLLLRTAFLESVSRYNKFYSDPDKRPSMVLTFSQRLSMYPAGAKVKGGGTTSYSWFIWDNENKTEDTILRWIEPGIKE